MLLGSVLRSTAGAHRHPQFSSSPIVIRKYASKSKSKLSSASKNNKSKKRVKESQSTTINEPISLMWSDLIVDGIDDVFELLRDLLSPTYDRTLDVAPNGQALFTIVDSFDSINHKNACTYMDFRNI